MILGWRAAMRSSAMAGPCSSRSVRMSRHGTPMCRGGQGRPRLQVGMVQRRACMEEAKAAWPGLARAEARAGVASPVLLAGKP